MYPDSSEGLNKETSDAVYFFTPAFHVLDSFSAHTIRLWGKTFPTAEHEYQWKKTGKRNIIENSPVDSFWGCGPDGNGQNMIGKIWMETRNAIIH
jgi:predicted NAD-dependent protein-ADP-ribosyltransferase YbiA (DUF1768 family)